MITPDQFAELMRGASDEDLVAGLRENGALILDEIFRQMEDRVDPQESQGVEAIVEWHIRLPDAAEPDRFQVAIADGRCKVQRDGTAQPRTTLRVGGLDFLKIVAGQVNPLRLFMFGKMKVEGDLMFAARMNSLFEVPEG